MSTSYKSSVIRQKGESQNGCFKKIKHAKFSKKQTFLPPWYTRTFFGKFGVHCFLETPVSRFAFLPYYRRDSQIYILRFYFSNYTYFKEMYKTLKGIGKIVCIRHNNFSKSVDSQTSWESSLIKKLKFTRLGYSFSFEKFNFRLTHTAHIIA